MGNPDNVYLLFDDFNDGTLDTGKWSLAGPYSGVTVSETNQKLQISGTTANDSSAFSSAGVTSNFFGQNFITETTFSVSQSASNYQNAKANFGALDSSLQVSQNNWAWWDSGTGWQNVASTTLMQPVVTDRRVGTSSSHGVYRGWEDGAIIAERLNGPTASTYQFYKFGPQAMNQTFTATFDDIVVRKYVNNEPVAVVDGTGATTVLTKVDLSFTFSVAGQNAPAPSCNGVTPSPTITTTDTVVPLGSMTSGTAMAAQTLSVGTNAASGYTVYVKRLSPLQSASHSFTEVPGTNTTPDVFPVTEAFGYTTNALARFALNKWAALTASDEPIATQTSGPRDDSFCLGYQVRVASSTPAGAYNTTVVYTAVPAF